MHDYRETCQGGRQNGYPNPKLTMTTTTGFGFGRSNPKLTTSTKIQFPTFIVFGQFYCGPLKSTTFIVPTYYIMKENNDKFIKINLPNASIACIFTQRTLNQKFHTQNLPTAQHVITCLPKKVFPRHVRKSTSLLYLHTFIVFRTSLNQPLIYIIC
jgi:hypothetical protein